MAVRIFALIVGVDCYKSGRIRNLQSCKEDARRMKNWLVDDLDVPDDQIHLLLDHQATKNGIEDAFMSHLVNNPAIERGDAILFYFAGYGSSIPAPPDWYQGESGEVPVLCPHDQDTRGKEGRVAGISDRSFRALIDELESKGDNITVILDCGFSLPPSRPKVRYGGGSGKRFTRWTRTFKATGEDLYSGLWRGAIGQTIKKGEGFHSSNVTHTMLTACGRAGEAKEDKHGGIFTRAFFESVRCTVLHEMSYARLIKYSEASMDCVQHPLCLGAHKHRILFDSVPFTPDPRYVPVVLDDDRRFRIGMGAIHGIVEGTDFTLHSHNHCRSSNPPLTSLRALEVHSTYSFAPCQPVSLYNPGMYWAKVARWNNRTPFRVYLNRTLCSLFRWWKTCSRISAKEESKSSKGSPNILLVKQAAQADIILDTSLRRATIQRNDELITENCRRTIHLKRARCSSDILEDAAHFHLHLHRQNPENPLRDLVTMELYRLDPYSWSTIGGSLLEGGKAHIAYERDAIYTLVLRNDSDIDLWPYLVYMDPNSYRVTLIYHPSSSLETPPLQRRSSLEIGSGSPRSEALSFTLPDHGHVDSSFLKLFVSSTFTLMRMIDQEFPLSVFDARDDTMSVSKHSNSQRQLWDTASACVTFLRDR
jgi:hypothetical protein